ncbi:hypothetical protein ACSBR1_037489 [Camellia fascicularis]
MQVLRFHRCNRLRLIGLKHINSPRNHISISNCSDVTIFNLQIISPENSPNTDGINISHSTQVIINTSIIATGKF